MTTIAPVQALNASLLSAPSVSERKPEAVIAILRPSPVLFAVAMLMSAARRVNPSAPFQADLLL
jgi:hypothetical protein